MLVDYSLDRPLKPVQIKRARNSNLTTRPEDRAGRSLMQQPETPLLW
jgi:hypothetical protein